MYTTIDSVVLKKSSPTNKTPNLFLDFNGGTLLRYHFHSIQIERAETFEILI